MSDEIPPTVDDGAPGATEDARDEDDLVGLLAPLRGRAAQDDDAVPAGFAARVVAAMDDSEGKANDARPIPTTATFRERFFGMPLSAGLAALAATLAVALFQSSSSVSSSTTEPAAGMATLALNASVAIGDRGLAVAERGGKIAWAVDDTGATSVNQTSGRMFYRVAKSGPSSSNRDDATPAPKPFVVHTPHGDVRVLGTCFSVEINPMVTTQQLSMWNKGKTAAVGALAGAVLTGAILVTVYEGKVDVATDGAPTTSLGVGEAAIASTRDGTRKVTPTVASLEKERVFLEGQRKELRAQVAQLEGQLKVVMVAKANGKDPVVAENIALKDELSSVRSRLSAYEDDDAERRGKPMEWPDDVDDIYKEDYLKESMLGAIAEVGLKGDIDSVDCSEFPCVAFGEVEVDGDRETSAREMKRMREALEKRYPDKVSSSNSIWSKSFKGEDGKQMHRNNFGISFYPDGAAVGDEKKALEKRMRYRMQSYTDSLVE